MEGKIVTLDNLEYFYEKLKDQSYVKYVAQSLSDEQKAQVRENIGVPSMEQLMTMYNELLVRINNIQNSQPQVATLDSAILDNTTLA